MGLQGEDDRYGNGGESSKKGTKQALDSVVLLMRRNAVTFNMVHTGRRVRIEEPLDKELGVRGQTATSNEEAWGRSSVVTIGSTAIKTRPWICENGQPVKRRWAISHYTPSTEVHRSCK